MLGVDGLGSEVVLCKGVPALRWKDGANVRLGWRPPMAEKTVFRIFGAELGVSSMLLSTENVWRNLSLSLLEGDMRRRQWDRWDKAFARAFPFWTLYLIRKVRGQQK